MHLHEIVHVYFGILKTCFIDELHIVTSHCLTCNVHNNTLDYSIIKHYTNIYISSAYSPFSDRVGLPLHCIPSPGVVMKSIGINHMRVLWCILLLCSM